MTSQFMELEVRTVQTYRFVPIASISSMNTILGWHFFASLNNPATSLLLSPNHLFVNTLAAMLMNVAPDSFASAFASIVFPHPGGPKSSTPLGAPSSGEDAKRWGKRSGKMTDSRREVMIGSSPPMS